MRSGHMEEVKEDQDIAKVSSLITEAIQEHVILPIHQGIQQTIIILLLFLPPGYEIMSSFMGRVMKGMSWAGQKVSNIGG